MTNKTQGTVICFLALLLAGCASASGPFFDSSINPPPQKALILFFRPDVFFAGAVSPAVYLDGGKVRSIDNGSYIAISAEPGAHAITVPHNFWNWDEDCSPVVVQASAGSTYYVELALDVKQTTTFLLSSNVAQCHLLELNQQDALPLIKLTRASK
jgi:hypothetical protein